MNLPDRNTIVLHWSVLSLGFIVWRGAGSILGAMVAVCAIEAGLYWFFRSAERRNTHLMQSLDRLNNLSLAEAKSRAIALLPQHTPVSLESMPAELTVSQKDFFARFNGVSLDDGTTLRIGVRLEPSTYAPGFFVLGVNTCEIVARTGDDRVWEIDGPLVESELQGESYASIWHWVLIARGA